MDRYEIPILEYLHEAYLDEGLFPANVGGWIKTYRVADDLNIPQKEVNKCCDLLFEKKLIIADSKHPNFQTSQPLIKIFEKGIEYLRTIKNKFIDAWHFERKEKEDASLAESWEKTGVHPHVRLEIDEDVDTGEKKKATVYVKSNFISSVWDALSPTSTDEYSFYKYYHEQQKNKRKDKGYLWLRGSGFWKITNIEKREKVVKIFLEKAD
ncbi:hypothetical protein KAX75_05510 [candidate division WOR-3 bacterium]|nr:hypothetical protein [candidate division WOR-3 bacterium]